MRVQKLTYAATADKLYGLDGAKIHVFNLAWHSQTGFSSKVKNLRLKGSLELPFRAETLETDFSEQYVVVRRMGNDRTLFFFRNEGWEEEGATARLEKEAFCLRLQHDLVDFIFCKQEFLARAPYRNFLLVQTKGAFIIYRENERAIFQSVFSIGGEFPESAKAKFVLFPQADLSPESLRGAFFYVRGPRLCLWYIENLMGPGQPLARERHELETVGVGYSELITVALRDPKELVCLFYMQSAFIANVNFKLHKTRAGAKVKALLLVNRHVDSPYFIYNQYCPFVYGKLAEGLHGFHKFAHKLERKFQYRSLAIDLDKYLRGNFWTLINDQEFLVLSIHAATLQTFKVLSNNNVVLVTTLPLALPQLTELSDIRQVRFSYINSSKVAFVVETPRQLFFFEIMKKDSQSPVLRHFFSLEKAKELGQERLDFYQLVFQSVPTKTYRLFILKNPFEVAAYNIDPANGSIAPAARATFAHRVHELYKSKKYPYHVIVLDETETLHFLGNNLQVQMSFRLETLRHQLPERFRESPFLDNFSFKHLYDRFYLVRLAVLCLRPAVRRRDRAGLGRRLLLPHRRLPRLRAQTAAVRAARLQPLPRQDHRV